MRTAHWTAVRVQRDALKVIMEGAPDAGVKPVCVAKIPNAAAGVGTLTAYSSVSKNAESPRRDASRRLSKVVADATVKLVCVNSTLNAALAPGRTLALPHALPNVTAPANSRVETESVHREMKAVRTVPKTADRAMMDAWYPKPPGVRDVPVKNVCVIWRPDVAREPGLHFV